MNNFPNREAVAIKLRELRDREMKVGRGPTPRGEDWDWADEILEAALGNKVLYVDLCGCAELPSTMRQVWPLKENSE